MARFFGTFEHTIDEKGRLTLPARFRAPFDQGGYLTQGVDGCLALWAPAEFETQTEAMLTRAARTQADRNLVRLWASSSVDVQLDRQGRILVPARLRSFAGLDEEVLIVGFIDRVELWDPARWQQRVGPEERRLTDGVDL